MIPVRAALYLDFDNVFSGLLKLDPDVAIQFAENPGSWLTRLSTSLTVDGPRRWLVLRCYMNPAGWVPHPDPEAGVPRLYFSRFRPFFTSAGFEVIDCPRLTHTKNAADIRLVVDAVDALGAEPAYDEFVIASGDSDMTPLLVRLRAGDRRTTVVSPSDAARAFTAVADRLVDGQQVLELVQGEQIDLDDEEEGAGVTEGPSILGTNVPVSEDERLDRGEAFERFRTIVTERYVAALGPLNLASLALELRRELGGSIDESRWFGFDGFVRSLESLELPNMRLSQHFLWDGSRHETPDLAAMAKPELTLPESVARLTALLSLPRLPHESWSPLYQVLSSYASSHQFNLTEATRWSRDRLVEQGVDVSRKAVGFVTRAASFAGCPLWRKPPPTAVEIGAAFVENVLSRAEAAAIALTAEETEVVQAWLGQPQSGPEEQRTQS
jgi:uncharacterized LabA/DUF88 family protein